jgi:hypothetical protein
MRRSGRLRGATAGKFAVRRVHRPRRGPYDGNVGTPESDDPLVRVQAALRDAQRYANVLRSSPDWHAAADVLNRIRWIADLALTIPPEGVGLTDRKLALVVSDAEQLRQRLAAESTANNAAADVEVVAGLADRLADVVGAAAAAARTKRIDGDIQRPTTLRSSLADFGRDYGNDASREQRLMVASDLAAVGSVGLALLVAWVAAHHSPGTGDPAAVYTAYASAFVLLSALAGFFAAQARRHRIAAQEFRRIARQIESVDAYLAPLPVPTRNLLRATMLQRLFPRLLDDDDPMREPRWPNADHLLHTILEPVRQPRRAAKAPSKPPPVAPPTPTPTAETATPGQSK